jgi:hypothetical protein
MEYLCTSFSNTSVEILTLKVTVLGYRISGRGLGHEEVTHRNKIFALITEPREMTCVSTI